MSKKFKFVGVVTDIKYILASKEHFEAYIKDIRIPFGGDYYPYEEMIQILNKNSKQRFYVDEYPVQEEARQEYLWDKFWGRR